MAGKSRPALPAGADALSDQGPHQGVRLLTKPEGPEEALDPGKTRPFLSSELRANLVGLEPNITARGRGMARSPRNTGQARRKLSVSSVSSRSATDQGILLPTKHVISPLATTAASIKEALFLLGVHDFACAQ